MCYYWDNTDLVTSTRYIHFQIGFIFCQHSCMIVASRYNGKILFVYNKYSSIFMNRCRYYRKYLRARAHLCSKNWLLSLRQTNTIILQTSLSIPQSLNSTTNTYSLIQQFNSEKLSNVSAHRRNKYLNKKKKRNLEIQLLVRSSKQAHESNETNEGKKNGWNWSNASERIKDTGCGSLKMSIVSRSGVLSARERERKSNVSVATMDSWHRSDNLTLRFFAEAV